MSGLGDAASKIGEKVVEILDIFDLSFFISGAVVMAALLQFFGPITEALDQLQGAGVFGLVLGSYVLGLVCFAVGRPVRTLLERKRARRPDHELFHQALVQQGLGTAGPDEALRRYFGHGVEAQEPAVRMAMYTRMWAHVRSYPELQQSFSLLNRYWVLSASYDGLAIAALVWLLPVWQKAWQLQWSQAGIGWAVLWTLAILAALAACWHRSREYKRYQIEEIVATVAHWLCLVGRRELEGNAAAGRAVSQRAASVDGPSSGAEQVGSPR
jgi:hypothetical protein